MTTPRERVNKAIEHTSADRTPVDFLATPEIWERLIAELGFDYTLPSQQALYDATWERLLQHFEVDCRVISYDQFYAPPVSALKPDAEVNWWAALSRSTPNRMWRQIAPSGDVYDLWGHHIRIVENPTGGYEEFASWPLKEAETVEDVDSHDWPQPEWWDFSSLPTLIDQLDEHDEYHLRFRAGSVFELAWQLRGLQEMLMDLALKPEIPQAIMRRITDVIVANIHAALDAAGDRIDMVYFYDDVATQKSLMISQSMWEQFVKPCHTRIIEATKAHGKKVMYHCDGALRPLIPALIEMGVDVLNPIQADAPGMEPEGLKQDFGEQLSFHGGIDIIETLPKGTVEDVRSEVRDRITVLGANGGYVMASSHHIQSDTPLENIFAMYDTSLRMGS
jgi:uroporphyrinogen decarboxylase